MELTRRQRLAYLLDSSSSMSPSQMGMATVFLGAAVVAATAFATITVPSLSPRTIDAANGVYWVCGTVFLAEYLLRIWLAPQQELRPVNAWVYRRRYLTSGLGIVDLLSALPIFLIFTGAMSHSEIGELTLLSLCKSARYVASLGLLTQVVRNEARSLISVLLLLMILVVLASGLMYRFEHEAQPESFSSIPTTIWWAVVTVATVGYGDMTPTTELGRVFGGLIMILGVATFAMPAGILASGFASEMRRRNFLVTWQTVADVPLFSDLNAGEIAEITRLLRPHGVPAHRVVVHHGDAGDAMYFIMSGEVEVEITPTPVRLKEGQYFGEIALLKDIERTATVITNKDCQLLSLPATDFRNLMKHHPNISEKITRQADGRLQELEIGHGDTHH
ncbi:MAG: cyclic nucleotide-binding domain-containing protein [Alphaproteobacteria bacterium]|nr:cyclic nucleotide-binding domain-containing protein [Alphaproteobacteria bacterium]